MGKVASLVELISWLSGGEVNAPPADADKWFERAEPKKRSRRLDPNVVAARTFLKERRRSHA